MTYFTGLHLNLAMTRCVLLGHVLTRVTICTAVKIPVHPRVCTRHTIAAPSNPAQMLSMLLGTLPQSLNMRVQVCPFVTGHLGTGVKQGWQPAAPLCTVPRPVSPSDTQYDICQVSMIAHHILKRVKQIACQSKTCRLHSTRSSPAVLLPVVRGSNSLKTAWFVLNPRADGAELTAA
jgi:hypothetical protein